MQSESLKPRSQDAAVRNYIQAQNERGLQLFTPCRFDVGFECVVFLFELYLVYTFDNIFHSQYVSSKRHETSLAITCSHSAETVEFRSGFKLLQLAFRFQTLTVSVTVSHFFMPGWCWNTIPKRNNFVPFSNRHRVNGV